MKLADIFHKIRAFFKKKEIKKQDYFVKNTRISVWEIPGAVFLVIKKYGWMVFFYKTIDYIRICFGKTKDLFKKAIFVLKKEGVFVLLKYFYKYLVYGRQYFSSSNQNSVSDYEKWIKKNENFDIKKIKEEIETFAYMPKFSIITPVYNVDSQWLNKCIDSVRNQFYENWELCLHDDSSIKKETIECLKKWEGIDPKIKISYSKNNSGISSATNNALRNATGEFVVLLDNDDELSPIALFENAKLLNAFPDTDMIYSDEDKICDNGDGTIKRFSPFFKPDWDPQMLFNYMYTGHLAVYRKKVIEDVGMFRSEFDFSQDYDLALRVAQETDKIRHLQKVLYHWRTIPGSGAQGEKDYARKSNIAACQAAIERRGINGKVVEYPYVNRVIPKLLQKSLVSIIIPSDNEQNIINCVDLVLKNSSYINFEIIIVTNSSIGQNVSIIYKKEDKIKICYFDKPFNFSSKCNEGAKKAKGEFLLFLNDDIEVEQADWMENMIQVFAHKNVGAVSPMLFYENNTIQYAGMITGARGFIQTAFHCYPKDSFSYFNFIQIERNTSIISGACLCMPKYVFEEIKGFDAVNTPIMHSDVDLSFRLRERGYNLMYVPFVSLKHIGHLSLKENDKKRKTLRDPADMYILKMWGDFLSYDPFFTKNMREYLLQGDGSEFELIAGRQERELFTAKNLLLISHDLSLSGAPILLYYLAKFLRDSGFFVTIISPCNGPLADYYKKENIPTIVDSTIGNIPYSEFDKLVANYDLVILNTLLVGHLILRIKKHKIPIIWFIHESSAGLKYLDSHREVIRVFKHVDDIVFACEEAAALYKKFINISTNVHIITNGIEYVEPVCDKNKLVEDSHFVLEIIHAGSIEPRKGQDILIKSLRYIPEDLRKKFNITFVGRILNDEYWLKIKREALKYKNIKFIEHVPLNKLNSMIQGSDIFVCSSRDEVFPLTILAAMSYSKPVIATNVGGIKNIIKNNENGFLVKNEDSKGIAESISFFLKNKDFIKKYGEKARKNFCDKFTIKKTGNRIISVINNRI